MIVERSLSIKGFTRQLFNELPIRLENSTIGPGKMYTLGLSSQCLMVYLASTVLPSSSAIKKRTPSSCSRYSSLSLMRGIGAAAYSWPSSYPFRLMAN